MAFEAISKFFKRTPETTGGGKDSPMSETATTTPAQVTAPAVVIPPAANGGSSEFSTLKSEIAELLKPVTSKLAELEGKASSAKGITAADIEGILDKRDQARQQTATATASRNEAITRELKNLPAIYQNQMPVSADPKVLSDAAEKIRVQFREDQKAQGVTVDDKSGAPAGGAGGSAPGAIIDLSKLSPMQKVQLSIQRAGSQMAPTAK